MTSATKKLALFAAVLVCLLATGQAYNVPFNPRAAGGSCSEPTYLVEETFEATGTTGTPDGSDLDWTIGGTGSANLDPDYSTSGLSLRGSEALYYDPTTNSYIEMDMNDGGASDMYIAFLLRIPNDTSGTATDYYWTIDDYLGNAQQCAVSIRGAYEGVAITARGGSTVNVDSLFSANTTYRVLVHYAVGSGTDSLCEMYLAAENATSWGTVTAESTNGTWTNNVEEFRLRADVAQAIIIDQVKVSYSSIPICALD